MSQPVDEDFEIVPMYGAPFSDWPKPEEFKPVTINPPDSLKTKLLELIEAVLGIKLQKPEVLKVQALAAQIKEEIGGSGQ